MMAHQPWTESEPTQDLKYWAFISYSNRDQKWARWLHRSLESYRVPKRLAKTAGRRGKTPERIFPIFRDREELSTSADLGQNITRALRDSRYLIVVCSPRAAKSQWVNKEIIEFKGFGGESRVFALIVDGEPNASLGKTGFNAEEECFPPALRFKVGPDGHFSDERTEPIAADVRRGYDGPANAKLKLLAGLLSVDYDALRQRELERRRRFMAGLAAITCSIALVMAVLAAIAFVQAKRASDEAFELKKTLSRSDLAQAEGLLQESRRLDAVAYLARAIRGWPENWQAANLLISVLLDDLGLQTKATKLEHTAAVKQALFSPDGKRALTISADTARIWDAGTGEPIGKPLRHDGDIDSAAFSPDSQRIVTASKDRTARVWDAVSGEQLCPPLRHRAEVNFAIFDPTGRFIATASEDRKAQVWDAKTGLQVGRALSHHSGVNSVEFSPDGQRIVTASDVAQIWDAASLRPIGQPLRCMGEVKSVVFSPDGLWIMTVSTVNEIQLWDAATGHPMFSPLLHNAPINSAELSPDSSRIAAALDNGTVRIWNAATGEPLRELRHGDKVNSVAFSADGQRIVTASNNHTVRTWDAASGQPIGRDIIHDEAVNSAAFSPDGRQIISASDDHTARISSTLTGRQLGQPLPSQDNEIKSGAFLSADNQRINGIVNSAAFSQDGRLIATASNDHTARIWNALTGKPVGRPLGHGAEVNSASFSPDCRWVVTASRDSTAQIWDASNGNPVGQPLQHDNEVNSALFSPDSRCVATASKDRTARIWDTRTGQLLGEPLRHRAEVKTAVFSPNGQRIVTASDDGTARIWDALTCQPIGSPIHHGSGVNAAAFSPDGQRIVTASNDWTARIWDAATGQPIGQPLQHRGEVYTAVFSPNGQRIVTASRDGTARIWDSLTGQPIGQPLQHGYSVHSALFSADGLRVITAADDHTARVWDALTGKPLAEPLSHDCIVNSAAFSIDGHQIVTALDDNTARVWWASAPVAAPAWLADFAEAFVERRVNDETGAIVGFSAPAQKLEELLPAVAHTDEAAKTAATRASEEDFYAEAVQWLLTPVTRERRISPWSPMTLEQYVIERVAKGSPDEAFMVLPYYPLTLLSRAELLQLLNGREIASAAWLRSYVLSLPASECSAEGWRKCGELLAADNYPNLAKEAMEKAQLAGR